MDNSNRYNFEKFFQNRKLVAFTVGLMGMILLDLTISASLLFWITPLLIGIIAGLLYGSASGGAFVALGSMLGRFLSMITMAFTTPGMLRTGDLFLAAIGDVLGSPLPAGSLIIILVSMIISALLSYLGGTTGGSAAKIVRTIVSAD